MAQQGTAGPEVEVVYEGEVQDQSSSDGPQAAPYQSFRQGGCPGGGGGVVEQPWPAHVLGGSAGREGLGALRSAGLHPQFSELEATACGHDMSKVPCVAITPDFEGLEMGFDETCWSVGGGFIRCGLDTGRASSANIKLLPGLGNPMRVGSQLWWYMLTAGCASNLESLWATTQDEFTLARSALLRHDKDGYRVGRSIVPTPLIARKWQAELTKHEKSCKLLTPDARACLTAPRVAAPAMTPPPVHLRRGKGSSSQGP